VEPASLVQPLSHLAAATRDEALTRFLNRYVYRSSIGNYQTDVSRQVIDGPVLAVLGAVGFGVVDLSTSAVSRRLGVGVTLAGLMVGSIVFLVPVTIATASMPDLAGANAVAFVVIGTASAVAYLALVLSLRIGPLSIVGPVTSSVGAATALLAIVVLREQPTTFQVAGIGLAIVGTALAAILPGSSLGTMTAIGPGAGFAIVDVLAAAIMIISLRDLTSTQLAGPILVLRIGTVFWLAIAGLLTRWHPAVSANLRGVHVASWIGIALALGVLDTVSLGSLSLSFRSTPAWLVGIATSISTAIVTLGGVIAYGERVNRRQILGITLLAMSLATLSITE
jgi:drug/metabolite transporter (DMT)-like permease